jgi:hypothetical protein
MEWRDTIERFFAGARSVPAVAERCRVVLLEHGFTPESTLFANATCRDELNVGAVECFASYWGEKFDLAGLGGYPSAGVTGFSAYQHHVPDGGKLLVLYGSHVGVDAEGVLGRVLRHGMSRATTSCGALLGFLDKVLAARDYTPAADRLDVEQNALESALLDEMGWVVASSEPIAELTRRTFRIIDATIEEIIGASGCDSPVALLGGITINTPQPHDDMFVALRAEIRSPGDDQPPISFLERLASRD